MSAYQIIGTYDIAYCNGREVKVIWQACRRVHCRRSG